MASSWIRKNNNNNTNNSYTRHGNDINNSSTSCLHYLCIPSTNIPLTANRHLDSSASDHPSAIPTVLAADNNDHHDNNTNNNDTNNRNNTNGVIVADATNGNDVYTISHNRNDTNYNHLPARNLHPPFNGIPPLLAMMKFHILHPWITSPLISPLHHPTNSYSELLNFITKLIWFVRNIVLYS